MSIFGRSFPRLRRSQGRFLRHRLSPSLRLIAEVLEERWLLTFTPTLVGTPNTQLSDVVATPDGLPSKLVTIMNNSNEVVFPILYDANSTQDLTIGQITRITLTGGGSGYSESNLPQVKISGGDGKGSGAAATPVVNGAGQIYALNLTSGGGGYTAGVTPIVEFLGGVGGGASADAFVSVVKPGDPPISIYDPLDAYNQGYRGYIGEYDSTTQQVNLGLLPGHQVTVQVPLVFWDGGRLFFASNGDQPLQNATDPGNPLQNTPTWNFLSTAKAYVVESVSGQSAQPYSANFADPVSGYANSNGRVMWYHDTTAHDFGTDGPGQLTEWTIRDPEQVKFAPDMDSSQILTIFNYDVSYVDNLTLPAAMEITRVPTQLPPDYMGPAIAPATYAALGTDLTIAQMQQAMAAFTLTTGDPNNPNSELGDYFGGRGYDQFFLPSGPNGIDFDKLPAGYNLFAVAPNNDAQSQLDTSKYQLVSGGNRVQVDTHSTGIATKGSNQLTNVDPTFAAQLAAGMLYKIVNWPPQGGTMPIFPQGTYITKVDGTTVYLSNVALQDGPDQSPSNQLAYTFAGSQFVSSTGSTNGTTAEVTGLDPQVGILLRPGMLVAGPGISTYLTIDTISPDFKTVTLTGGIPAAGSTSPGQSYRFTGGPDSYVVSTLINNWYSWADYYVDNVDAVDVPTVTGTTYGNLGQLLSLTPTNKGSGYTAQPTVTITGGGGTGATATAIIQNEQVVGFTITNPGIGYTAQPTVTISGGNGANATAVPVISTPLTLDHIDPSQGQLLRVGDTVSGPNIDPKSRTTIAAISADFKTVTLSNPVSTNVTGGSYSFGKPLAIPRSPDAQPYKLSFDPNVPSQPGQDPIEFARSVYDVMQGFSHLNEPTYLSQSALLLQYCIGCNIGTFALQAGQALPVERVNQLRDELKSILRGVADFSQTPEFSSSGDEQWYPDPATKTSGAMIDYGDGAGPQPASFGVYNLNPYVWFIHIKLGMSGYGFSVDDDTANAQDAASSIQVAYGGTATTAPGASGQQVGNMELYTYGAPFGTLHDEGHIDTTSGVAKGYDLTKFTVISGLSLATVGKLKAFDAKTGQGALVTGFGMTESSRVFLTGPSNPDPNAPGGANASYVVLLQPSPSQDGNTGPYTFSGFNTTLPSISSFSPGSGTAGSSLVLKGTGFTEALGVTFNGLPAESFKVNDDTSITVTVPDGATTGKIGVRGPAGTRYSSADFTVVTNQPAVTVAGFVSGSSGRRETSVDHVDVAFSEPIDPASFGLDDLTLQQGNAPLSLAGIASLSFLGGTTWRIGNLAALTSADADYTLSVRASGVQDTDGIAGRGKATTAWTVLRTPPRVRSFSPVSPDPTRTAVDEIDVTFTEPVDATTFSRDDLILTRDGVVVPLSAGVMLAPVSDRTWRISGLAAFTGLGGKYALTVKTTDLTDESGIAGGAARSVTWTADFTAPTVRAVEKISPSPRNVPLDSLTFTFTERIDPASFDTSDLTLMRGLDAIPLGSAQTITRLSGMTYRIDGLAPLTGIDGSYVLTVNAAGVLDEAGNAGVGSASGTWTMDTLAPVSSVQPFASPTASKTTLTLSITGTDPSAGNGAIPTGIKSYDIFVSIDGGPFVFWKTVNASKTSPITKATYVADVDHTYAFHSIARDGAGNVESKRADAIDASITVPDLAPPATQVADVDSTTSTFVVAMEGADVGANGIVASFDLFVSIDGGPARRVARVAAGSPDTAGVYHAQVNYSAKADGLPHSYRFFSRGTDGDGNFEAPPSSPADVVVNATFAAPHFAKATAGPQSTGGLDALFSNAGNIAGLLADMEDTHRS